MYQFRIDHNNFPSTKFSLWIFHMVILPLAMISELNILKLHKMKPWHWKSHHNSSGFVKKQMDSFVPFLHHFNHLQTHCVVLLPCMPRIQPVFLPDVLYKLEKLQMSICLTACNQCLDFNNSTLSSNHHHYPHMPGRNNTVH